MFSTNCSDAVGYSYVKAKNTQFGTDLEHLPESWKYVSSTRMHRKIFLQTWQS